MTVSYPQVTHVISGNTDGVTALISSGTYNLAGGANITLSQNGNNVSIIGGAGGGGGSLNISAGTTSNNLTNVVFSNSNGISFGLNGSTITGTVRTDYLTTAMQSNAATISNINLSAGTTSNNLSAFVMSNSNGMSFGLNGSTITGSYTVPAIPGAGSISAGTTSATLGQVIFSNSNSVSFGMNAGTVTATVSYPAQTTQPALQSFSAGTTRITTGEVVLSNSNGISFGANGQTVTASYTVPSTAGLLSAVNLSAGTTSNNLSAFTLSNSNGISFGLNGSVITGSHNALTSQSNQNVTAANGGFAFQTLSFSNVNGFSFGTSAGSAITGSYTVPTQTVQTQNVVVPAASNSTYTSGTVVFTGSNNITVSYNGQTIQISGPTTAAQTNQTLGLYAVSNTTLSTSGTVDARTLSFQGAGIASVGVSNGSVIVSVPAGGGAGYSAGLSNIGNTSGDTGTVSNQLVFAGGNNITLSGSTNGGSMTVTISAPNLGAGGGIAAAAGTQTATSGTVVFSNSNNMTFGMSNSSVITASYLPPGISDFVAPWAWSGRGTNSSLGQNTLYFMPVDIHEELSASRINFYPNISISLETGNSSGTGRFGIGYGIYTRGTGASSERISLLSSYSMTFISHSNSSNNSVSLTHAFGLSDATSHSTFTTTFATSNASTYVATNLNGHRALPMPLNLMMTPGRYFLGVMVSRTATSAVANSLSMHITSVGVQPEVRGLGFASAATNASVFRGGLQGLGSYSATTNAFPNSIALSTDNIRAAVNATLVHFDIKGYGYSSNVL